MKATNLAGRYDLPLLDWAQVEARLNEGLEHGRTRRRAKVAVLAG
jgi:hypothetical protein